MLLYIWTLISVPPVVPVWLGDQYPISRQLAFQVEILCTRRVILPDLDMILSRPINHDHDVVVLTCTDPVHADTRW